MWPDSWTSFSVEDGVIESPKVFLFLSFLFHQQGAMDLSKVGEKLLSSVRSARSLPFLPPASDRPEVPARAVAAAAVARALAGLPPHQRLSLPSNSEELVSIYGQRPRGQVIEELEEEFYEQDFDPIRYVLEHISSEEDGLTYFEKKAAVRLTQLDAIAERLSRHVMEHHEEMVKGMQLVMEVEQDLRVANVICMNGRRHLTSATHEVSRDLVVISSAKKKQALLDMLPILTEIRHAIDMRMTLELLVEAGNYFKAFQVLSEYLQVLESFSELSAVQEMSRGVEVWLANTLQKLDSLLLSVCQEFRADNYITVVDAYALIGDISGLAEKIQSFFMQEVLSKTHYVLKDVIEKELGPHLAQRSRLTYSDLCLQIPESKFRQCLLTTLDILFKLMISYYEILSFQCDKKESDVQATSAQQKQNDTSDYLISEEGLVKEATHSADELTDRDTSTSYSPFDVLRNDAIAFVAQTLQRGRRNLWQLTTSRLSVLLSSSAVCSASTHQFLRNYEDLNVFILSGEAFCGVEAIEFRQKIKVVCESYFSAFHRQNIYAFKMVLEKETWLKISPETIQAIGLAGLLGDGAPIIAPSNSTDSKISVLPSRKLSDAGEICSQKNGFAQWIKLGNPFAAKLTYGSHESPDHPLLIDGTMTSCMTDGKQTNVPLNNCQSIKTGIGLHMNGNSPVDDENEDLLADFIDEDSQLPSRISRPQHARNQSMHTYTGDVTAYTGSSLCLLRLMDKYARLMQKLEIVNVEFFRGICQLFEIFFHFIYETFGQRETCLSGKGPLDCMTNRLKTALLKITQDCDQWVKPQTVSTTAASPTSSTTAFTHMDVTPTSPSHAPNTSFGLKERCAGAETLSVVAQMLHKSKTHMLSMLLQSNTALVEDFYTTLVDTVPDLIEHIHRTTAKILLHLNGYVDRIANAKWELKDLGLEHNGYVDLLLGEFKHYKTRLAHSGIPREVQDLLIEYGLENVAEVLVEGLSRVKRCTDEGRALMSLDLQVLINGLQHFVSINVKPKMQVVDTFVKAYYLPETEYVHWARSHPEYTKNQIIGLVNLVAAMKSWKRKTRLEVLERIEIGNM